MKEAPVGYDSTRAGEAANRPRQAADYRGALEASLLRPSALWTVYCAAVYFAACHHEQYRDDGQFACNVYRSVTQEYVHGPVKVGIRGFREKLAAYLLEDDARLR